MKITDTNDRKKFIFQRNVAIIGVLLFIAKLVAWFLTNSDAVFSDAMESIVNIIAGFMGLFSLYLASKPRDEDHPYGHGKIEFITSGIEGSLIILAGIMIIAEAVDSLINGNKLDKLDYGIFIVAFTAIVNYVMGYISYKKGVAENSLVLQSSGKHLMSDTVTTGGVVLSLIVVYFTKIYWIDAVIASVFGLYIMFVGSKIVRKSASGIMDEADTEMLGKIANTLSKNRKPEWIDIHNLKVQQHGSKLHLDAHITLPYYYSLRESHKLMEQALLSIVSGEERHIEFNLHMDDCKSFSCEICQLSECKLRERPFVKKIEWNAHNISQPQKHRVDS